jgi:hypothetical protein
MFSADFSGRMQPDMRRVKQMSYTFGPHTTGAKVYYAGDNRVVESTSVPALQPHSTPAWVVADYMLSKSRGDPLTAYEEVIISQPFESENLRWLQEYLREK